MEAGAAFPPVRFSFSLIGVPCQSSFGAPCGSSFGVMGGGDREYSP